MKPLLFVVVLLMQATALAAINNEDCLTKSEKKMEMDIISSNIANVATTRTPEGGPYQRQSLVCVEHKCEVQKSTSGTYKYVPDHPDSDAEGYVKFPDINLEKEMQKMVEATRAYEKAAQACPATADEVCAQAKEKKATYNLLVKKLSKDPGENMDLIIGEIKKTSQAYKELNSQCKK